jgi:hypothetical protein
VRRALVVVADCLILLSLGAACLTFAPLLLTVGRWLARPREVAR